MELTTQDIIFARSVATKDEALRQVADALTRAGLTHADYLHGLLARESQISTYLGNGIAIPHGTAQSRDCVVNTGVKVLVCPQGVAWGEAQRAYLIVGIAARDNEHLDILRQLTHVLAHDDIPQALARAGDAPAVLDILAGRGRVQPEPPPTDAGSQYDAQATFTLTDPHGLHARPGAVLVNAVKQWQADIRVENLDTSSSCVDAKSLMRVISLGAKQGHRLRFSATGPDAQAALSAIGGVFRGGFTLAQDAQPKRHWLSRWFSRRDA